MRTRGGRVCGGGVISSKKGVRFGDRFPAIAGWAYLWLTLCEPHSLGAARGREGRG